MVGWGGTTRRLAGAMAGVVLVMSACRGAGPSTTPGASPASTTPSQSETTLPSAGASAAATASGPGVPEGSFAILPGRQPSHSFADFECTGQIGANDPVAIVQLHSDIPNGGPLVLRDYADVAHPRTVCTFGTVGPVQLIDARHVVIGYDTAYAVVEIPELRYQWFELPVTPGWGSQFIAVSSGLDQIAWRSVDPQGTSSDYIHIATSAGDQIVATLRDTNEGRCSSPDDSRYGDYSSAGSHLYVMNQPLASQTSFLVFEGQSKVLSILPPAGDWPEGANPAMAVWSPTSETLLYRLGDDVWKWTAGADPAVFLPGVRWFYPTISADGAYLAYAVVRADALHDVYVVDLLHDGTPKLIGGGRHNYPVFVNATQLWLMAEALDTGCADSNQLTPKIYNVISGQEAGSIIDWTRFAWPATSSNW